VPSALVRAKPLTSRTHELVHPFVEAPVVPISLDAMDPSSSRVDMPTLALRACYALSALSVVYSGA
jgi:hypothetical protein